LKCKYAMRVDNGGEEMGRQPRGSKAAEITYKAAGITVEFQSKRGPVAMKHGGWERSSRARGGERNVNRIMDSNEQKSS